jgi:hypothetical protein
MAHASNAIRTGFRQCLRTQLFPRQRPRKVCADKGHQSSAIMGGFLGPELRPGSRKMIDSKSQDGGSFIGPLRSTPPHLKADPVSGISGRGISGKDRAGPPPNSKSVEQTGMLFATERYSSWRLQEAFSLSCVWLADSHIRRQITDPT